MPCVFDTSLYEFIVRVSIFSIKEKTGRLSLIKTFDVTKMTTNEESKIHLIVVHKLIVTIQIHTKKGFLLFDIRSHG